MDTKTTDYISRRDLLARYDAEHTGAPGRARELIEQAPAADVAPVRHGRWIKPVPGDGENYCSVCKAEQLWFYGYGYLEPNYCPNCGARMDKGEQHDS